MSVPASRKPDPKYYREHLRAIIIWYLVRNETFDRVVADLRPLWDHALDRSNERARLAEMPFSQLPERDRNLLIYRAAVATAVKEDLHCREFGQPAGWVCQAVHGAVSGNSMMNTPEPDTRFLWGDLRIPVFNIGSAAVGMLINGQSHGEAIDLDADDPDRADVGEYINPQLSAFSDWDGLRKAAHKQLEELLNEMKRRVEADTRDWKAGYRKGHQTRVHQTMSLVVEWLIDGESLWASDRPAGHALLRELGLDQPQAVGKSSRDR